MGYFGRFRSLDKYGNTVMSLNEPKCSPQSFIQYAALFNAYEGSVLKPEKIQSALKLLHGDCNGYQHLAGELQGALKGLRTVGSLLDDDGISGHNAFDENGNLLLVIKKENNDHYGNALDCNFYTAGNTSDTPEAEELHSMKLSDEELANIRKKRVACFTISERVFYSGQERINITKLIENIKTRRDVIELMNKYQKIIDGLSHQLSDLCTTAISLETTFDALKSYIEAGEVSVALRDGLLEFSNKEDGVFIKQCVIDTYPLMPLFDGNENDGFVCYATITPDKFEDFRKSTVELSGIDPEMHEILLKELAQGHTIQIGGDY